MSNIKSVQIGNRTAVLLAPEDDSALAVVHLSVIQRLAQMLPKGAVHEMAYRMSAVLAEYSNQKDLTIETYVGVLKAEVAFHETVNLIANFDPEGPGVVADVTKLTLTHYLGSIANLHMFKAALEDGETMTVAVDRSADYQSVGNNFYVPNDAITANSIPHVTDQMWAGNGPSSVNAQPGAIH